MFVYISSCVTNGGIYRYNLTQNGEMQFIDKFCIDKPMYTIHSNNTVYVLQRQPFGDSKKSGILSLSVNEDGSLLKKSDVQLLGGEVSCHLAISPAGNYIYTADYISGTVTQISMLSEGELIKSNCLIKHLGKSIDPERQTSPHPHCTVFTPDKKYLCVVDLGLDKIILYSVDDEKGISPKAFSSCSLAAGVGPRHLVFSKDGKTAFCANELKSSITVLKYDNGKLTFVNSYSTLPNEFMGKSFCAAIRMTACGKFLYVSNRGHDSITCFAIEGEKLRVVGFFKCGGCWPRDFDITPDGSTLICTNERSDNVSVFSIDKRTGELNLRDNSVSIKAPLCVVMV